jgi:short-subunit dehydrogenase
MSKTKNTVAFITGASSGIGAAMAEEFARRGADVVLVARRRERLQEVAKAVQDQGRLALVAEADVTRDGDLETAVEQAEEQFGRIDWVVANAGFGVAGAVHKLELEDYRRQFETNIFGVLRTVRATRDSLISSGGVLALMGSVTSYVSLPVSSPYSMSKHAVKALADSLRAEMSRRGVAVTLLAPGFVESEIRQVDNKGERHEHANDPIPPWLRMQTAVAARKMVRAIVKRKRVVVITLHGKVFVFIERHFPWLMAALARPMGDRKRHRDV